MCVYNVTIDTYLNGADFDLCSLLLIDGLLSLLCKLEFRLPKSVNASSRSSWNFCRIFVTLVSIALKASKLEHESSSRSSVIVFKHNYIVILFLFFHWNWPLFICICLQCKSHTIGPITPGSWPLILSCLDNVRTFFFSFTLNSSNTFVNGPGIESLEI